MWRNLRIIRENIYKLVAVPFFILALIWIKRHLYEATYLLPEAYLRLAYIVLVLLFFFYLLVLVRSIFYRAWLRRFDPADPESLDGLASYRRYQLPDSLADALRQNSEDFLDRLNLYLRKRGFQSNVRRTFGQIYERKLLGLDLRLKPRHQRVMVLYRPLLNVIVVDQMLKEASEYIESNQSYAKMNQYIMLTDMQNDQEVLSAAAGIVNFLGKLKYSYLSPTLIDIREGRIFFPLDRSLLNWRQKLFHDYLRYDLIFFMRRQLRKSKRQHGQRRADRQEHRSEYKQPEQRPHQQSEPRAEVAVEHRSRTGNKPPRPKRVQGDLRRRVQRSKPPRQRRPAPGRDPRES
ncbi:MAG: hypothetical protein Q4P65_02710 [Eubacteriales bacterium]|nr:hypothetical protein [Eubacteriales bacterium]